MDPITQIKLQILQFIRGAYRQVLPQLNEEDKKSFQSFFWKIRPLVEVDTSIYDKRGSIRVYDEPEPAPESLPNPE